MNKLMRTVVSQYNSEVSGRDWFPLKFTEPGFRVWTRGDGSRHCDPGHVIADHTSHLVAFWGWLAAKGGKYIGHIGGNIDCIYNAPAIVYGGVLWINNGHSIEYGRPSRVNKCPVST